MTEKIHHGNKRETYEEFVEKFKPKHTTDDCYTPAEVYETVVAWARENLPIGGAEIVRPFWPGGDYENFDYPEGCVVIDNPPFSIYSKIVRRLIERGIRFLLFAPSLTQIVVGADATYIIAAAMITYENGAVVRTGFTTNMTPGTRVWICPELRRRIEETQKKAEKEKKKAVTKVFHSPYVTSAALLQKFAGGEREWKIPAAESAYVTHVGESRYRLFGVGILLSQRMKEEQQLREQQLREQQLREQQLREQVRLTAEEMEIVRHLSEGRKEESL